MFIKMPEYEIWVKEGIFSEIHQMREALETYCLTQSLKSYTEEDIVSFRKAMELAKTKLQTNNYFSIENIKQVDVVKEKLIPIVRSFLRS